MIRIVRKSTLGKLEERIAVLESLADVDNNYINILEKKLHEAQTENLRLFDHHNKRLQKPKPDKNGVLRDKNGRFAKK